MRHGQGAPKRVGRVERVELDALTLTRELGSRNSLWFVLAGYLLSFDVTDSCQYTHIYCMLLRA